MATSNYFVGIPEIADHCYTATEWIELKRAIMNACITAEYLGLFVGLSLGALITYLILRRKYAAELDE